MIRLINFCCSGDITKPTSGRLSSDIQDFPIPRGSRLVLALTIRGPSPGGGFAETLQVPPGTKRWRGPRTAAKLLKRSRFINPKRVKPHGRQESCICIQVEGHERGQGRSSLQNLLIEHSKERERRESPLVYPRRWRMLVPRPENPLGHLLEWRGHKRTLNVCWCEEEISGNRQKSCQILNSGAVKRPKQRRDLLLSKRFFASRSSAEDTRRSRRRLRGLEEEQTRLCGMCGDVEPTCFSRGRRDLSMDKPRPPGRGPALVTPTAPKSGWS